MRGGETLILLSRSGWGEGCVKCLARGQRLLDTDQRQERNTDYLSITAGMNSVFRRGKICIISRRLVSANQMGEVNHHMTSIKV